MLGIGLAATRDIVSFFRHATKDGSGAAIPWRARSSTRWQPAIRSREISSRHSSTSASTRICQVAASGTASFRASQPGKRPSTSALPCPAARRRSTSLAASLSSGGAVTSIRRAAERPPPPRSLHGVADVPEGRRGIWRRGVLGASHVARTDWHRREARHPAARQRSTLLLSGYDARRRTRRIPRRRCSRQPTRLRPACQPESAG